MRERSLCERLGGYDAVSAVANDLLPRLQADSRLGRFWNDRGSDGVAREKQLLIFMVGSRSPATWTLWCRVIATAGRYMIAAGPVLSSTLEKPHPLRFIGALSTYVAGLALCVALLASI